MPKTRNIRSYVFFASQGRFISGVVMRKWLFLAGVAVSVCYAADPVIEYVNISQRLGTRLVDIEYKVTDVDGDEMEISVVGSNLVDQASVPMATLSGDGATNKVSSGVHSMIWDAGADWGGNLTTNFVVLLSANDGSVNTVSFPCPVAKTGQTTSYHAGDDGDLQSGVAWPDPRFTDLGDGTVVDNLTGLQWIKEPHAVDGNSGAMDWNAAIDLCNELDYAGYTDWRLPSYNELISLISFDQVNPALPASNPFVGLDSRYYWTGTTCADYIDAKNFVHIYFGESFRSSKSNMGISVLPVRSAPLAAPAPVPTTGQKVTYRAGDDGDNESGVTWPSPRFLDNGTTVIDLLTGLEWVKKPHAVSGNMELLVWDDAVTFCDELELSNYDDWRLPSINEIRSLLNHGEGVWGNRPIEWLYSEETPFDEISYIAYWSSTSLVNGREAWTCSFSYSELTLAGKTDQLAAWPVRTASSLAPAGGDATAQSWEVIDDRWVKNIYANGDITLSDLTTGIMWPSDAGRSGTLSWSNSVSYCDQLSYAGYSDWQLPDEITLSALMPLSYGNVFTNLEEDFWSSSALELDGNVLSARSARFPVYQVVSSTLSMEKFALPARRISAPVAPDGMVHIPVGTNAGTDPDFGAYSLTLTNALFMDKFEVSKQLWDEVYSWAITNGYSFENQGLGKAYDHPVHTVNWYDCVKWCNARSEKAGLEPCYTVSGIIYRSGRDYYELDMSCNFACDGYRLPTSEEWEYAARGGISEARFAWGYNTARHSQANYNSDPSYDYDRSPTVGYHPDFNDGFEPYTCPVGTFSHNGYGLHNMAGNVREWCWEGTWSLRKIKGGSWSGHAGHMRNRYLYDMDHGAVADTGSNVIGFRTVRSSN